MVSLRCKLMVRDELKKLGIKYSAIELGIVDTVNDVNTDQLQLLKENLLQSGLELLDDKKSILIERVKNVVIEMIHYSDELPKVNYSEYISQKLGYNYTYLSNLFSEVKGVTLQQFIIMHRIEKAKEMLLYDEYNLTEISYRLQYSSVAHLSSQFRKITGLTPSYYKQLKRRRRDHLESL
jgi:AraC-like DNA-binding protein